MNLYNPDGWRDSRRETRTRRCADHAGLTIELARTFRAGVIALAFLLPLVATAVVRMAGCLLSAVV